MNALILGGTGTLGQEIARQLLKDPKNAVTVFSRDELKQKEMAGRFGHAPGLRFIIGDVRDPDALELACRGRSVIFHCAAIKHVDIAEANPEESIKTNLLASQNVARVAVRAMVPYVAFSSTDKAVDPINTYGLCKALSEKIFFHYNTTQAVTRFSVFRWGNVLGSRGSIVKPFAEAILAGKPVPLTDAQMTRFWLPIQDAVRFMIENYKTAPLGVALIPSIRAASVGDLAVAIGAELGQGRVDFEIVGIRPGEKIHEALRSQHSHAPVDSRGADQYTIDELRALVRPLVREFVESKRGVA